MTYLLNEIQDEYKRTRTRNIKSLADILENMDDVIYRTTWSEAQRLLMENGEYVMDKLLQSLCFLTFNYNYNKKY